MAFTYDIATDRGQVRFGIGDTNEAHGLYTDAEVDYALTSGGSVDEAINILLRHQKAVHAVRGDATRTAPIDEALDARNGLPTIDVLYPAALPMDDGWSSDS